MASIFHSFADAFISSFASSSCANSFVSLRLFLLFFSLRSLSFFFCSSPLFSTRFAFFFSLPSPDPGSLTRLFSPVSATTVCAFAFIARRLRPFPPWSTHIEMRVPTLLGALSGLFTFFLQMKSKVLTHVRFEHQDQLY